MNLEKTKNFFLKVFSALGAVFGVILFFVLRKSNKTQSEELGQEQIKKNEEIIKDANNIMLDARNFLDNREHFDGKS